MAPEELRINACEAMQALSKPACKTVAHLD